ncbi:hypothetical protein M3Y99_01793900 [Aphelenchoides fujianensis]|nr:hypothetical protein M3Y99_01793900 [Aphelenchoides fujianensis]
MAPAEVLRVNKWLAYLRPICRRPNGRLPTRAGRGGAEWTCVERGGGAKEVVVLGNSIAFTAFVGVVRAFRPLARRVSLLSLRSCVPAPVDRQQSNLSAARKRKCGAFLAAAQRALREWERPIDVVISLFGYNTIKDPPITHDDAWLNFLNAFYGNLSAVAREAVIVPGLTPFFPRHPLRLVHERLTAGRPAGEDQLAYLPHIRRRLEHLRCTRCLRVDWIAAWCGGGRPQCAAADPRGVLSFFDQHHPSLLGTIRMGELLRDVYVRHKNRRLIE